MRGKGTGGQKALPGGFRDCLFSDLLFSPTPVGNTREMRTGHEEIWENKVQISLPPLPGPYHLGHLGPVAQPGPPHAFVVEGDGAVEGGVWCASSRSSKVG